MTSQMTLTQELLHACQWMRDFIEAVNEDRVSQDQLDLYASMMKLAGDAVAKADIFMGYLIAPRSDGGWNVYLRDQHIYAHENKDEAKRWIRAYRNGAMWAVDEAFAD